MEDIKENMKERVYKGISMSREMLMKYNELKEKEAYRTDTDFFAKLLIYAEKYKGFEQKNIEIKNLKLKIAELKSQLKDYQYKFGDLDNTKEEKVS